MAKPKIIKGVTCKNGYWYASIDGKQKYCGKGDKGYKLAKTARMKWEVKQYENREINAGLRVKKTHLKNVLDLSNWYMQLPSIQEQISNPTNRGNHHIKSNIHWPLLLHTGISKRTMASSSVQS